MANKKTTDEYVVLYGKLIATIPELERKGAANPYTSINGNMFTILHQSRHWRSGYRKPSENHSSKSIRRRYSNLMVP